MGWASGLQSGMALARAYRDAEERQAMEKIQGAAAEESQGYTEAQGRQLEGLAQSGGYDIVPQYAPAAEGQTQGLFTGYQAVPKAGLDLQGDMPAAPQTYAPQRVTDFLGQRYEGGLAPERMETIRTRAMANAVADPRLRQQMLMNVTAEERAQADAAYQQEIRPLQKAALVKANELGDINLRTAQRGEEKTIGFDTAFAEINKTEYKTPEEKDAAILAATQRFKGPDAEAELRSKYSAIERNNLLNEGTKFDQKIKQARLKGPAEALKAIDELNDSFTLEIDGFKVTQVNKDGTRVPFMQAKNADEFAVLVDSKITEGGAFQLAKFRQDEQSKKALIAYYEAKTREAGAAGSAAANQLSGVQIGYSRDANGRPIQVMSGLRFNKKSGQLESVQVQLEQNVVPPSALDPKKIADQANELVGRSVDPTNPKSKDVHTFATAQQAVVDQIFNQYLGTGKPAGGLDLSPAAVAERMLNNPPAPAPAAGAKQASPMQTGSVGIDTNRPRTNINPVTGQPRETPGSGPNLVAAVNTGLDAAQERYKVYLQTKIANNQALTPDETLRARRFGLQ